MPTCVYNSVVIMPCTLTEMIHEKFYSNA